MSSLVMEWVLVGMVAALLLFPGPWSLLAIPFIVAIWLVRWRTLGYWRVATPADPAIVVLLVTAVLGVLIATDRALSLNRMTVFLLGALLYESTVVTLAEIGLRRQVLYPVGLVGLAVGVLSLLLTDWSDGILVPLPALYDHLPRLSVALPGSGVPHSGGLVNPRAAAGAALLLWPLNGVLLLVRSLPLWQRLFHASAALLLLLVVLLSQSPQGFLALLATLIVFFLAAVGQRLRWVLLLGGLIALPVTVLALINAPFSLLPLLEGRAGFGLVARLELWIRAVRMIRSAPLTGIGLNGYAPVMNSFYPGYVLGPEAHAHNLYLQSWTDQGVFGLAGLLGLVGVAAWATGRLFRQEMTPLTRATLLAVVATIAGWLIFGLFEVLSLGHKPGVVLWLLLAIPLALARREGLLSGARKLWLLPPFGLLLALVLFWQSGALLENMATITAQQALSPQATLHPTHETAYAWLDQTEARLGPRPQLVRLRGLLQMAEGESDAAVRSFREVARLEGALPLWWWAPAPVLTGQLPPANAPLAERARGLASIYQHWHTRFPERAEPVMLLASVHADVLGDLPRATSIVEQALIAGQSDGKVLRALLSTLSPTP